MIAWIASLLGYILKFLFDICGNFGIAIILFTIVTKVILAPLMIKQQRSLKNTAKFQPKLQEIQEKYKDDKQKYAEEVTRLQKEENFNPFSGCLLALVQIPIILAMYYIVANPLTYMEKMDPTQIESMKQEYQIVQEAGRSYPEIELIKKNEKLGIDLNFLGMNLGDVPIQNKENYFLFIIPILSVLITVGSMKINNKMQEEMNKDNPAYKETQQSMKGFNLMLPLMSGFIACQVPLGLGLYWMFSNLFQIVNQKVVNWYVNKGQEKEVI